MTEPDHTCTARALPFSPTGAPVIGKPPKLNPDPGPPRLNPDPGTPAPPRGKK